MQPPYLLAARGGGSSLGLYGCRSSAGAAPCRRNKRIELHRSRASNDNMVAARARRKLRAFFSMPCAAIGDSRSPPVHARALASVGGEPAAFGAVVGALMPRGDKRAGRCTCVFWRCLGLASEESHEYFAYSTIIRKNIPG